MRTLYITQNDEVNITDDVGDKVNITFARSHGVNITFGFILLLAAVTLLSGFRLTLVILTAAGVHELGHLAAIWLCGGKVEGVRLGACGAEIVLSGRFSYLRDALIALSGPLAGGLCVFFAAALGSLWPCAFLRELCAVSALYTVFNLFPLGSMDGGRALYALSAHAFGPDAAGRICLISNILSALALLAAGTAVLFVTRGNFSALICAVFVIIMCCKNR